MKDTDILSAEHNITDQYVWTQSLNNTQPRRLIKRPDTAEGTMKWNQPG